MSQQKIEPDDDVDAAFEKFLNEVTDEEKTFYDSVFDQNSDDHPDMWFSYSKDCKNCQGFANKTDGCGNLVCPDCHSKVHGKPLTTATTTATASDKKPSTVSTRSDKPNRCKKGAGCSHVKTGNCRFFHPAEEIPVCRFGVRCNKGKNCKFRH